MEEIQSQAERSGPCVGNNAPAEQCWIPDLVSLYSCDIDEDRFTVLIRKSYDYITDHDDSIFYSDDASCFTYVILGEEAVIRNDMPFFLKVNEYKGCLAFYADRIVKAIWDTKRFEFFESLHNNIKCVHNRVDEKYIDSIVKVVLRYYSAEQILDRFYTINQPYIANSLIDNGIPFNSVLEKCDSQLQKLLLEDQI